MNLWVVKRVNLGNFFGEGEDGVIKYFCEAIAAGIYIRTVRRWCTLRLLKVIGFTAKRIQAFYLFGYKLAG